MYEELIKYLRCHQNKEGKPCLSCSCQQQQFCDTRHDTEAADALEDLITQLTVLQSENAELQRDAEQEHERYIETLGERDGFEAWATVLGAALARVEAERDAAIAEIPHVCSTCGRFDDGDCPILAHKDYPADCEGWEWRGGTGGR